MPDINMLGHSYSRTHKTHLRTSEVICISMKQYFCSDTQACTATIIHQQVVLLRDGNDRLWEVNNVNTLWSIRQLFNVFVQAYILSSVNKMRRRCETVHRKYGEGIKQMYVVQIKYSAWNIYLVSKIKNYRMYLKCLDKLQDFLTKNRRAFHRKICPKTLRFRGRAKEHIDFSL
jgi:hypothetical protein